MPISVCRVQDSFWMGKPGPVGLSIAVLCATDPTLDNTSWFGMRLARYLQESGQHIADIGIAPGGSELVEDLIRSWRGRDDLDLILICDEAVAATGATVHVTFTREQQASERTQRLLRHPDMEYLEIITVREDAPAPAQPARMAAVRRRIRKTA